MNKQVSAQLESQLGSIITDKNLLLVVGYLERYLEAKAKAAWELEALDVEHWYNASGYCRMVIAELEQTIKNE